MRVPSLERLDSIAAAQALDDEYYARATYRAVLEAFGDV